MTTMRDYGIPETYLDALADAKANVEKIEAKIAAIVTDRLSIKKGDLVEYVHSGNWYKVCDVQVAFSMHGQVRVYFLCRRYWRTGRKAKQTARSTSYFTPMSVKKVEQPT